MTETQARFLTGSIFRHVVVMTLTGAIGLMTLFVVDLADLYFLSRLGDSNITAAIGFAGTLDFANLSLSIGTGIAAAALVSRNLGAGNPQRAKEFATTTMVVALAVSAIYTLGVDIFIGPILSLLGATGEAAHLAKLFIWTLSPGFVFIGGALTCSFSMRGLGDARRAMFITLSAAIGTLILDPIFIFQFGWGIQGTAAANALADALAFFVGFHGLYKVHDFLGKPSWAGIKRDLPQIMGIASPAVISQLATPFAAAYLTYVLAPYGNDIVGAGTVVNRIVTGGLRHHLLIVGFGGTNHRPEFGAKDMSRVSRTLTDAIIFAFLYALATSLVLYIFRNQLAAAFNVTGRAAELVVFFATYIAATWAFVGSQFVAMAAFNNLGKPSYSTYLNWGKSTLGTIPFALVGAAFAGPEGVMIGVGLGGVVFGVAAAIIAFRLVRQLSETGPSVPSGAVPLR